MQFLQRIGALIVATKQRQKNKEVSMWHSYCPNCKTTVNYIYK